MYLTFFNQSRVELTPIIHHVFLHLRSQEHLQHQIIRLNQHHHHLFGFNISQKSLAIIDVVFLKVQNTIVVRSTFECSVCFSAILNGSCEMIELLRPRLFSREFQLRCHAYTNLPSIRSSFLWFYHYYFVSILVYPYCIHSWHYFFY